MQALKIPNDNNAWSAELVAQRFEACADTLNRLPQGHGLGYCNHWPEIKLEPREIARQKPGKIKLLATPRQITEMEQTLTWFKYLAPGECKIIWLRAFRYSWRNIARKTGYPVTSARRYWLKGLEKLATKFNDENYC